MLEATPELPFPEPEPVERWLPVPGWENLYEVSDLGRTRSVPRMTHGGVRGGKILAGGTHTRCNYRFIVMSNGPRRATVNVHRLVLEAFVGPCPPGMECLHGPGGPQDNRLVNLSWGTRSKNHGHDQCRDGKCKCGEKATTARLTQASVDEIKRQLTLGVTRAALARQYRVSWSTINAVYIGKTWSRHSQAGGQGGHVSSEPRTGHRRPLRTRPQA